MMMIVSNMCLQKLFAHCRHFGGVGNPDRLEILIRKKKPNFKVQLPISYSTVVVPMKKGRISSYVKEQETILLYLTH